MALNAVQVENGRPVLNSHESILLNYKDVQLTFHDMKIIPSAMKGKWKGEVFLTHWRVIFLAKDQTKSLKSLSMPVHLMEGLSIEQGFLSANYIKGKIKAQPEGGWEGAVTTKLTFHSGGAIEFGKAIIQVTNHASRGQSPYSPVVYVYETITVMPLRNRNLFRFAEENRNFAYVPGPPPPTGSYYVPVPSAYTYYGYPPPTYYGSMQPPPNFTRVGTPGTPPLSNGFTPPATTGIIESPPATSAARTPDQFNPSISSMQNYYVPPLYSNIEQPQQVVPADQAPENSGPQK
ncbi:WW domain-binding protein 2-like isoform X2 [Narcine bancroftii]|uniref:WW domain-binding protein 2-like isoform X2 n=1 Tax=Narcine bancroftii TaxID=1343680 RepID=UPI00383172F2